MTTASALDVIRAAEDALAAGCTDEGFLSERWGLLPTEPPLTAMPASHRTWDDVAGALTDHFRTTTVRDALDRMPVLDASPAALPDAFLWRAASLLGIFAHAYVRVRPDPPQGLPPSVEAPWAEVCGRLHRDRVALTYDDLIVCNWRLRDPSRPERRLLDNLELLTPTVDNREERIFYLTQVEILALGAPMIAAMARAQEAVVRGDRRVLEGQLMILQDTLERVTRSFLQIDANPYSDTYVDPVVWAKTVAPFAVQIRADSHAVSGAAAPLFQVFDVFLGRTRYESRVGREACALRAGFPPRLRALVAALEAVSVPRFIAGAGSTTLRGLWQSLLDGYVGREGFLATHRKKAFAYLELAFKVGRSVTTGGFTGVFEDQTWEIAHHELEQARQERLGGPSDALAMGCPMARLRADARGELTSPGMAHVVLDLEGAGVRYRPGDRLALLPESDPQLVERTLRALRADATVRVRLDARWIATLAAQSEGRDVRHEIPLVELLARGRIRPMTRDVAKALLRASNVEALGRIVNARAEALWELWDVLELVGAAAFDTRVFWRADPWEPHAICKLVPPQDERFFSLASAMPAGSAYASRAELLVTELAYETPAGPTSRRELRHGTASAFVRRLVDGAGPAAAGQYLPVRVVSAPRFRLPDDATRPIVMIAGGGGISPFLSFIAALAARAAQPPPAPAWLFLSVRSAAHAALYRRELAAHIDAGWLEFHTVVTSGAATRTGSGIAGLLAAQAGALLALARDPSAGGAGATFYACGAAGFAAAAVDGLEGALAHALSASHAEHAAIAGARELVRRMIGVGRYEQDVFTSHRSEVTSGVAYDASEVALHNDDEHGYWMIIDGVVYDVTEFSHRHPGGRAIVLEHAGRDATRSYRMVEHHLDPEIEAMLGMYRIGAIRRLEFGSEWCVTVGPKGLTFVALADAFRAWVRMLHLVVEVENAVRHDFHVLDTITVAGDRPEDMTMLKARMLFEAHERFVAHYLVSLTGAGLDELWSTAVGFAALGGDARRLRAELDAIASGDAARAGSDARARAGAWLIELGRAAPAERAGGLAAIRALRPQLERIDREFLGALKRTLAAAVAELEGWERTTRAHAGAALVAALEPWCAAWPSCTSIWRRSRPGDVERPTRPGGAARASTGQLRFSRSHARGGSPCTVAFEHRFGALVSRPALRTMSWRATT
jgi:sulfite reductase alpha subunit-like flavoprotein